MSVLGNSNRSVLKATYVPLKPPAADQNTNPGAPAGVASPPSSSASASAVVKTNLARNLRLQPGEVEQVRSFAADVGVAVPAHVWETLKQFEPQPLASLSPKPSALDDVPGDQLLLASRAILTARLNKLKALQDSSSVSPRGSNTAASPSRAVGTDQATKPAAMVATAPLTVGNLASRISLPTQPTTPMSANVGIASSYQFTRNIGVVASLANTAKNAINAYENAAQATPVGMLHLERIEMAPAGIERGELVATIPLAPGETTSVEQKEWTVTSQEFSSIVTDYLESYSEKGVTEKTELAESTESQTKHSQQLGLNASVSGSYGFVTFSTSASFNNSSEDDESKKASRNHATDVTQKASTRVRKEHKVTIQTSTVTGTSETSTRTLTNPSTTDTMRIDYFSIMRKWRVRLLRYGLRMTYDIAIPEPGATLRALHAQLADLNAQLNTPFTFDLGPSDITEATLSDLETKLGVALEPAPAQIWKQLFHQTLQPCNNSSLAATLEFDVKEGCSISVMTVGGWASPISNDVGFSVLIAVPPSGIILGGPFADGSQWNIQGYVQANNMSGWHTTDVAALTDLSGLADVPIDAFDGQTGHVSIPFQYAYASSGTIYASVEAVRTEDAYQAWQQRVWQAAYNTARDAYYTQLQALTQQRDALNAEIENVDTLTLRREEREEIMKGVLRWLLGPEFDYMPQDVRSLFVQGPNMSVQQFVKKMAEWFEVDDTHLSPADWSVMYSYGEMVKFIMEAIEWENLLYIVYPYFWDIPFVWDFVRRLQHPDPTREAFLRAGSARVVLTIRSGWEDDFLSFIEHGEFGAMLSNPSHPYMAISEEMKAYANTNYPGIPPANPETSVRPLLTPAQRKAWQDIQDIMSLLGKYHNDPKNVVNNKNTYPTTAQGLAALAPYSTGPIPATDPWGNPYIYVCPGNYNDYDLSSLGADGKPDGSDGNDDITSWANASLIGEWYEYTPSHGLDIGITTAFASMQ